MRVPRTSPRLGSLTVAAALTLALTGCGSSTSAGSPSLGGVPLIGGTRILVDVRRCDRGANPYCAVQLVVVGSGYESSGALLVTERRRLKALGWTPAGADNGDEQALDSPGHKLRVSLGVAALVLKGIDLGFIQRAPIISRVLAETMFDRSPAVSLMLEAGPA